jgi:hypothetical protein
MGLSWPDVLGTKHFRRAFTDDDDAGRLGVARGHPRHDRRIGDTKAFDAIDLQVGVHHG